MEFPELGVHCFMSECKQLDFLPFKCQFCLEVFCKEHSTPDHHGCQKLPEAPQGTDKSDFKFSCSVSGCHQKELVSVTCDDCGLNMCLQHRHPPDHNCQSLVPEPGLSKEQIADIKVKQIAASLDNKPARKGGRKDPKLAAKVQLMKLKMKAVAVGPSVPPEHRIHLLVSLPLSAQRPTIAVALDRTWSVGRALDAVADKAKIPNHNNTVGTQLLQIYRHCDGSLLAPSSKLSDLLSTGGIFDGETVVLELTDRATQCLPDTSLYSTTM